MDCGTWLKTTDETRSVLSVKNENNHSKPKTNRCTPTLIQNGIKKDWNWIHVCRIWLVMYGTLRPRSIEKQILQTAITITAYWAVLIIRHVTFKQWLNKESV